jgi:hypothetical protein
MEPSDTIETVTRPESEAWRTTRVEDREVDKGKSPTYTLTMNRILAKADKFKRQENRRLVPSDV